MSSPTQRLERPYKPISLKNKCEKVAVRAMSKNRGNNRKSTKNADFNLEQDNKPTKLAGALAELAEELTESTGARVEAMLATQLS